MRLRNNYHRDRGGSFPTRFRNAHVENVQIVEVNDETISVQGVK